MRRIVGLALERDPAPDFSLTNQAGQPVSLALLRGKVLLIDFVYTSCPGPCPIQTARHAALQRSLSPELRERLGARAAGKIARDFTLEKMVDAHEKLYLELLERKG